MGHFCIAKEKKQINTLTHWFYPWKKHCILLIDFCVKNINIVLCEYRSIYMSLVTHMGHINLKFNENYILFLFCTILVGMISRILCYNMSNKDLILLKKT